MNQCPPPPAHPTCASCDNCSLRGQFCHLWNVPTELTYSCDSHSRLKVRK